MRKSVGTPYYNWVEYKSEKESWTPNYRSLKCIPVRVKYKSEKHQIVRVTSGAQTTVTPESVPIGWAPDYKSEKEGWWNTRSPWSSSSVLCRIGSGIQTPYCSNSVYYTLQFCEIQFSVVCSAVYQCNAVFSVQCSSMYPCSAVQCVGVEPACLGWLVECLPRASWDGLRGGCCCLWPP